jgi:hypothetical protein
VKLMLFVGLQNYHEEYFLLRYIGDDRYINDHNFEIVCVLEQREAIEKVCDVRCDGMGDSKTIYLSFYQVCLALDIKDCY